MNCRECERLAANLNRRQEVYCDALGWARSEAEAVNPNHYFRLRKAVREAKFGLDSAVQDLRRHQQEHRFVASAPEHPGSTASTMFSVTGALIKTVTL